MTPPGFALLTARLKSPALGMNQRLVAYFDGIAETMAEFGSAPITAAVFACTGSSYLAGAEAEVGRIAALKSALGISVITAGRAALDALDVLGARRISLVSAYPSDLLAASLAYWGAAGLEIAEVEQAAKAPPDSFHPIYSLDEAEVDQAVGALRRPTDAVLILGTGVATLRTLANRNRGARAPVLSCNLCLAWRTFAVLDDRTRDRAALVGWLSNPPWASRLI
jgi:maleate cis-trans isomerase